MHACVYVCAWVCVIVCTYMQYVCMSIKYYVYMYICLYMFASVCLCVSCMMHACMYQRRLWQLGTGQVDYNSQSTPKKKCAKLLEYTQEGV